MVVRRPPGHLIDVVQREGIVTYTQPFPHNPHNEQRRPRRHRPQLNNTQRSTFGKLHGILSDSYRNHVGLQRNRLHNQCESKVTPRYIMLNNIIIVIVAVIKTPSSCTYHKRCHRRRRRRCSRPVHHRHAFVKGDAIVVVVVNVSTRWSNKRCQHSCYHDHDKTCIGQADCHSRRLEP